MKQNYDKGMILVEVVPSKIIGTRNVIE